MKCLACVLALVLAGPLAAAYTYDSLTPAQQSAWVWNGDFYSNCGSLIWGGTVAGNAADYEVSTTLTAAQAGGVVMQMLRASSTKLLPGDASGSYISVEFNMDNWPGRVTMSVNETKNGTRTHLGASSVSLPYMTYTSVRTLISGNALTVRLNGLIVGTYTVSLTSGYGGHGWQFGGGPSAGLQTVVGHKDTSAPTKVPGNVALSLNSSRIGLRWQASVDDANGTGVQRYDVLRNGTLIGSVEQNASSLSMPTVFYDQTAVAGTTYTYGIQPVDYHLNVAPPTNVSVTAPPATIPDARRTGVRPEGAYWGGGGEQIDLLSGNLNYSLPIGTAILRAGGKVPISLSYNSQNWRQEGGVNWQLGSDTGFGFGWKVQIGSITPYYVNWMLGVDHYAFTDGSGAEYRLDVNSGGVWSSTQAVYVWYDENAKILHFKDGSFWVMGCTSQGLEPDAGTLYPTVIEDVHGNQVIVKYLLTGTSSEDTYGYGTSGRISTVADAKSTRCNPLGPNYPIGCGASTFSFAYAAYYTGSIMTSRLQTITGPTGSYGFTYATASLAPPFGADAGYAVLTTQQLVTLSAPVPGNYQFTYDGAGSQELTTVKFPWGGKLRWVYSTEAYASGRSLRAVTSRYLAADSAGANEWGPYTLVRDSVATTNQHGSATLTDASGVGVKLWNFVTPGSGVPVWKQGLISEFIQKAGASGAMYSDETYTWTTNPGGHPYVSAKTTVTDPGANQQSALTTQTQDQFGNVTQQAIYPFNNNTTALKMSNSTYLTDATYLGNYIRDRVLKVTLTTGGATKMLAQNYYDGKTFSGQATYPTSTNGCSFLFGSYWRSNGGPAPTSLFDPAPPLSFANHGLLSASVGPTVTRCLVYHLFGAVSNSWGSDGSTATASINASTNYAAPTALSSQSYGETISYNSWLGVTGTTGWNGEQLSTDYDWYGRPTSGTSAYGAATTISYLDGIPRQQIRSGPGGWGRTTLDGLSRVIRVEWGQNVNNIVSVADTEYAPCACSPLGKLKRTSLPYAPGGTPVWTTYTYDGIGRTVSVQLPDGASTTTTAYLGNQTTVKDPASKWKTFTSDVEGNLVTVTEPNPAGGNLLTNYTYDWMQALTGVSMPRGSATQTRSFVHDDQGHLTSATNPESGTVAYYYNADNTLWYKHDAKGQDTVYTYDTQKRVSMLQQFPTGKTNAEDTCQKVTYTYGTVLDASSTMGRLASVQYSVCVPGHTKTVTESYNYHPAGALMGKSLATSICGTDEGVSGCPGVGLFVGYSRDTKGAVTSWNYSGQTAPFVYGSDWAGRHVSMSQLTGVSWRSDPVLTMLVKDGAYDLAGRLSQLTTRSGGIRHQRYIWMEGPGWYWEDVFADAYVAETRSYNVMGQLTSQGWASLPAVDPYIENSNTYGTVSYPNTLGFDKTVTYNYPSAGSNNGQLASMSDGTGGETVAYQYDALKRLISAASTPNSGGPAAWTETYGMDGFGNLTSKVLNGTTTSMGVDGATNRLVNGLYDANGNMTSGAGASLVYDEANRLKQASPTSGGTEYYGYAPDNKRVLRVKADGTEEWTLFGIGGEKLGTYAAIGPRAITDNWGDPTGEMTASFRALKLNVWFDGRLVTEGGLAVYQDRLGTNRASGARFRPYGDEIASTANDRVKFGTYTRDSFTGLDYADQRFYASSYGRFNTADPYRASAGAGDPGSWNRYAYVTGDPINLLDPGGTCGTPSESYSKADGTMGVSVSIPCGTNGFDPFFTWGLQNSRPMRPVSEAVFDLRAAALEQKARERNNTRCHDEVSATEAVAISTLHSGVAAVTTVNDILGLAVTLGTAATTGYEAAAVSITVGATASLPEALLTGAAAAVATYGVLKVLGIPEDKLVEVATDLFVSSATTVYDRVAAAQAAKCDTVYLGGQ